MQSCKIFYIKEYFFTDMWWSQTMGASRTQRQRYGRKEMKKEGKERNESDRKTHWK